MCCLYSNYYYSTTPSLLAATSNGLLTTQRNFLCPLLQQIRASNKLTQDIISSRSSSGSSNSNVNVGVSAYVDNHSVHTKAGLQGKL